MQDKNIPRVINTLSISSLTILDKSFKNEWGEITRRIIKFKIFEWKFNIFLNQLGQHVKNNI